MELLMGRSSINRGFANPKDQGPLVMLGSYTTWMITGITA
jgi:hypothetical protein